LRLLDPDMGFLPFRQCAQQAGMVALRLRDNHLLSLMDRKKRPSQCEMARSGL